MTTEQTLVFALKRLQARDTRVVDARWDERDDSSGRPAVFIALVLADPPPGSSTWPIEDVMQLKRAVRDELFDKEPEFDRPWFVELEPEHPGELDPEDVSARSELDAA
ncbi:MAG: hypothetical protein ACYCSI_02540 [Solirubrobacteraceae bacterium]